MSPRTSANDAESKSKSASQNNSDPETQAQTSHHPNSASSGSRNREYENLYELLPNKYYVNGQRWYPVTPEQYRRFASDERWQSLTQPPLPPARTPESNPTFGQSLIVVGGLALLKLGIDTLNNNTARRAQQEWEAREARERERRKQLERLMQYLGIDPSDPRVSDDDILEARNSMGYQPGARNIVFAGKMNAGKSSLLNAIRNRTVEDEDYAPTGASEVTLEAHRYPDPIHDSFVWYDTPGSGTESLTAFNHYYQQRLYAYDMVVLVHDSSLTQTDIRILQVCHLMQQPWVSVRTKCDMHISNCSMERNLDLEAARTTFLDEVRNDVQTLTQRLQANDVGFAAQYRDFVVSVPGVRRVIRNQTSNSAAADALVDEVAFLRALGLAY